MTSPFAVDGMIGGHFVPSGTTAPTTTQNNVPNSYFTISLPANFTHSVQINQTYGLNSTTDMVFPHTGNSVTQTANAFGVTNHTGTTINYITTYTANGVNNAGIYLTTLNLSFRPDGFSGTNGVIVRFTMGVGGTIHRQYIHPSQYGNIVSVNFSEIAFQGNGWPLIYDFVAADTGADTVGSVKFLSHASRYAATRVA